MNSIFLISIALFFFIVFHPQIAQSLNEQQTGLEVINKACSRSPDKHLCLSVFKKSNECMIMDLQALAYYALQEVSANASATTLLVKTYLDEKMVDKSLSKGLDMCSKTYIDAVDQIGDSMNAIISKTYSDANIWLNSAINFVKVCDDTIKGYPGKGQEISNRNQVFTLLCRNALSVVEVLVQEFD